MGPFKDIAVEKIGNVALVEIRRPPNNFFDVALIQEIAGAFEALDGETGLGFIETQQPTAPHRAIENAQRQFIAGCGAVHLAQMAQPARVPHSGMAIGVELARVEQNQIHGVSIVRDDSSRCAVG